MDVTITELSDDMTMQELATRCRLYRKYGYVAEVDCTDRTCAFCGRDDPCVICGGDWFCDGKCADNHTDQDALIKDLEAKIRSIRNAWLISCDDVQALEAEKNVLNDRIIEKALESQQLRVTIDNLMHENTNLERDWGVLMQVAKVVEGWDDDKGGAYQVIYKIVDLLETKRGYFV